MSSWTESEWDEEQQGWMLALSEYRAGVCNQCGHHLRDTTDETHDWLVPPPARCFACDAIAQAQQADKRLRPEALLWRAHMKLKVPQAM